MTPYNETLKLSVQKKIREWIQSNQDDKYIYLERIFQIVNILLSSKERHNGRQKLEDKARQIYKLLKISFFKWCQQVVEVTYLWIWDSYYHIKINTT